MNQEKWTRLFALNDRLTKLYGALIEDIMDLEKTSKLPVTEALSALDAFAVAMSKITDTLNDQLKEDRETAERVTEVEDVLRQVRNKIKLRRILGEGSNKDNRKASE